MKVSWRWNFCPNFPPEPRGKENRDDNERERAGKLLSIVARAVAIVCCKAKATTSGNLVVENVR